MNRLSRPAQIDVQENEIADAKAGTTPTPESPEVFTTPSQSPTIAHDTCKLMSLYLMFS